MNQVVKLLSYDQNRQYHRTAATPCIVSSYHSEAAPCRFFSPAPLLWFASGPRFFTLSPFGGRDQGDLDDPRDDDDVHDDDDDDDVHDDHDDADEGVQLTQEIKIRISQFSCSRDKRIKKAKE